MNLQRSIIVEETNFAVVDNVLPLCALAKGLEEAGEFEQAAETLRPFWTKLGDRPTTEGLSREATAELLLRAGTLTGWLGSARQIAGTQDLAKDLISESAAMFASVGLAEKAAEARVDLAICYWREGGLDEARITLKHVLDTLGDSNSEQRLRALLNSAIVEKVATRDLEALRIYRESASLFDKSSNHALKGKFHNSYATLLKSLGLSENREEYIDGALVEFTAASFHFEQAGHKRFQGRVENNVGFLYASIGRFPEAQEHLGRAHRLLLSVGDQGGAAGCDDTRAQAFLLEGKNTEAEKAAASAVRMLTRGGEQTMLAEALTTHGRALARLQQNQAARTSLDRAIEVAQNAGDPERGGIAAVSAIEELGGQLSSDGLLKYYRTAESLLAQSQSRGLKIRLGECARRVLTSNSSGASETKTAPQPITLREGFSLDAEVLRYEASLIRQALETAGGSVTRAARLLGVTHQGLAFILNGRHSDLLSIRTPVKRRRKSIIRYN
jgi:tetratricopeptide (TPR) repeat protein